MPLFKRKTYSGVVLEQEIFNIAPNTKRLKKAEAKPPPEMTPEERQHYNDGQALRRFIRNINANFGPWAFYITLTFADDFLPATFKDARPILGNYIRRLQYAAPALEAVAVMGRGIKSGRIHFHLIVGGVDTATITDKWTMGAVKRVEPLRTHNIYNGKDHGTDYTGLATYLFKHWTPEQGTGKRWRQTKNLKPPEKKKPQRVKRRYSETKPPNAPKGYFLVESRGTKYGYQYFKYVRSPDKSEPPPGGV